MNILKSIFFFFCLVWIVKAEITGVPTEADEVQKPVGEFVLKEGTASGITFEAWDSEKERFVFRRNGKIFPFTPGAFLHWGNPAGLLLTESYLVLTDGSFIAGTWEETNEVKKTVESEKNGESPKSTKTSKQENPNQPKEETFQWENSILGPITITLDESAGILFAGAGNGFREPLLLELRDGIREEDVLVFRTGERIEGEFLGIQGGETIRFQTNEISRQVESKSFTPSKRILEIAVNQLAAILFSSELRLAKNKETPRQKSFWIGLEDGSLFQLNPVEKNPDFQKIPNELIVYLETLQTSQKFFNTEITAAAVRVPELRWLDEIQPSEVHNSPILGKSSLPQRWNRGATPDGKRLCWGTKRFRHGIGSDVGVSLCWNLDETFHAFGVLPISEEPVKFRIYTNGNLVAEYVSKPGEESKPLNVELNGASELKLETIPASSKNQNVGGGGRIIWADAFLVP